jgi:hypothetical protein
MAEQRKARFRRVEPKYESAYRSQLMQDLESIAVRTFFEEFEIDWNLPDLPDAEKESFRQRPEVYIRDLLAESGFDPINAVAVLNAEVCTEKSAPNAASGTLVHITFPPSYASLYYVR